MWSGNIMSSSRRVPVNISHKSVSYRFSSSIDVRFGTFCSCWAPLGVHTLLSVYMKTFARENTMIFSFPLSNSYGPYKEHDILLLVFLNVTARCAWKKYHTFTGVTIHYTHVHYRSITTRTFIFPYTLSLSLALLHATHPINIFFPLFV